MIKLPISSRRTAIRKSIFAFVFFIVPAPPYIDPNTWMITHATRIRIMQITPMTVILYLNTTIEIIPERMIPTPQKTAYAMLMLIVRIDLESRT